MSENMFNSGSTPAPQGNGGAANPPNDQSTSPFADLLGSIRNERGEPKYKDVQTALEALRHSQEFIPQVKAEKDALEARLRATEEENQRLRTVEETLARLNQGSTPPQQTPAPNNNESGVTLDAVAEIVKKTLTQREQQAVQQANMTQVINRAKEVFGPEADKVFYSKAKELGMNAEQINSLSAQSPQAVFTLLGLGQAASASPTIPNANPQGSVNTAGYQPKPQSFIGRNEKSALLGASTSELRQEQESAKKLVEELHSQGMSTYDLTDPKNYFKLFHKE